MVQDTHRAWVNICSTGTGGDQSTLGASPENGETVAESGFAEMNRGVQGLKGNTQ